MIHPSPPSERTPLSATSKEDPPAIALCRPAVCRSVLSVRSSDPGGGFSRRRARVTARWPPRPPRRGRFEIHALRAPASPPPWFLLATSPPLGASPVRPPTRRGAGPSRGGSGPPAAG